MLPGSQRAADTDPGPDPLPHLAPLLQRGGGHGGLEPRRELHHGAGQHGRQPHQVTETKHNKDTQG